MLSFTSDSDFDFKLPPSRKSTNQHRKMHIRNFSGESLIIELKTEQVIFKNLTCKYPQSDIRYRRNNFKLTFLTMYIGIVSKC